MALDLSGVDHEALNSDLDKAISNEEPKPISEPSQVAQSDSPDQALEQKLLELDKVEKFRFEGKEMTLDELKKSIMRNQDYTKKTQELAASQKSEEKYRTALMADLNYLRANPGNQDLIKEFQRIYPKHYHDAVKWIDSKGNTPTHEQATNNQQPVQLPDSVMKRFEQLDTLENHFREQQTKAAEAEINSIIDPLSKKYPFVDEEAALARAQGLIDRGVDLTKESWEEIYKTLNDRIEKIAKERFSEQVTKQKEVNRKGADVPQGGGIPGGAPKKAKSFKEATQFLLDDIASGAV